MTTQTTTTVAAAVATNYGGGNFFRIPEFMQSEFNAGRQQCFPADLVASPPLPRIYCHPPWGTKTGKDRYRDCRQHSFRYREYRTLRSPRIY